jgi:hypothetical protein
VALKLSRINHVIFSTGFGQETYLQVDVQGGHPFKLLATQVTDASRAGMKLPSMSFYICRRFTTNGTILTAGFLAFCWFIEYNRSLSVLFGYDSGSTSWFLFFLAGLSQ